MLQRPFAFRVVTPCRRSTRSTNGKFRDKQAGFTGGGGGQLLETWMLALGETFTAQRLETRPHNAHRARCVPITSHRREAHFQKCWKFVSSRVARGVGEGLHGRCCMSRPYPEDVRHTLTPTALIYRHVCRMGVHARRPSLGKWSLSRCAENHSYSSQALCPTALKIPHLLLDTRHLVGRYPPRSLHPPHKRPQRATCLLRIPLFFVFAPSTSSS